MVPNNIENEFEKIGLFGGGFDPVHRAHIKIAKLAADQLGLISVRWIPAGNPAHKEITTPAEHRLNMLKIALKNLKDKRMVIDQRELSANLSFPSYTCETVKSLRIDYPQKNFFWILGEDQLLKFQDWKNWKWLLTNLNLVLCQRPEYGDMNKKNLNSLNKMIKTLEAYGGKIVSLDIVPDRVSSSHVRKLLSKRKNPLDLLDCGVCEYAKKNNLYSD
tara:strand:- start:82 stop:735 length:654 start_codon:yes stop_codon:yes gene_type:complete